MECVFNILLKFSLPKPTSGIDLKEEEKDVFVLFHVDSG